MSFDLQYKNQVELLLNILPIVNQVDAFALKGGTAINLFVRNMPRLSVDIDLTYIPIEPRAEFLSNFEKALGTMKTLILDTGDGEYRVTEKRSKNGRHITKLFVRSSKSEIKIEPNLIFRGGVYDHNNLPLSDRAQDEFLQHMNIRVVSFPDLYAGKICAALNRQHPRDLFDIKLLLNNEGITDELRTAFVVHLACDSRPMVELINPNLIDISQEYHTAYSGMSDISITLDELIHARSELITILRTTLTDNERRFLLSIKSGHPEFSLLNVECEHLPALQWKIHNIKRMDTKKHQAAIEKLKRVLEL